MIELIAVMLIIGILSGAALSTYFSLPAYNSLAYNNEVLNSIRYARKLAITTGGEIQVSVSGATLSLQSRTEGADCSTPTLTAISDPVTLSSGYSRTAPGNLQITTTSFPIYFDSLGRGYKASTCTVFSSKTIQVTGANALTIYGHTGFIQ